MDIEVAKEMIDHFKRSDSELQSVSVQDEYTGATVETLMKAFNIILKEAIDESVELISDYPKDNPLIKRAKELLYKKFGVKL